MPTLMRVHLKVHIHEEYMKRVPLKPKPQISDHIDHPYQMMMETDNSLNQINSNETSRIDFSTKVLLFIFFRLQSINSD